MTSSDKSDKCSFKGSGLCGKCPVGSQYRRIVFTPNASNSAGMATPPMEFTPSTTAVNLASLMALTSTSGCLHTACMCFSKWVSSCVTFPKSSTSAKVKFSSSTKAKIAAPAAASKNSPSAFKSFKAFHCFGLWLAVKIIPPNAFSWGTAISTVGVVAKPKSITLSPNPTKVCVTSDCIISPDKRASLPITMVLESPWALRNI